VAVASCGAVALGAIGYAVVRVIMILTGLSASDFRQIGVGLFATWLRVNLTLVLGALWTIPVGVAIDSTRAWRASLNRWRRLPLPFPHRGVSGGDAGPDSYGRRFGFGSIVLLLLGTQCTFCST